MKTDSSSEPLSFHPFFESLKDEVFESQVIQSISQKFQLSSTSSGTVVRLCSFFPRTGFLPGELSGFKHMASGASGANIRTEEEDGVLVLALDNPRKKNALTNETYLGIVDVLDRAAQNPAVTAVVITGAGDYFCSGTDVAASLVPAMADPATAPVGKFMLAILHFPKILVAAVNGPAVGIGVTLLPHCDLVYSATSATFWVPFLRIAVVPEFGSSLTFPRIMGPAVAGDMLLASRVLSADEAHRWGLVSELLPASDILSETKRKLIDILKQPLGKESLLLYKRMLRRWTTEEVELAVLEELKILGKRYVDGDTKHALEITMARQRGIRKKGADQGKPKEPISSRL